MTGSKRTVKVTRDQVSATRALVRMVGEDKVNPVIARIAEAKRAPRAATTAMTAKRA